MVKISFTIVFAACALVGNFRLIEAVDAGSASNDTSVSAATTVGDGSASTDTSVATAAAPATAINDTSASIDADVTTARPAATTAAPVVTTAAPVIVENGSVQTDTSASVDVDVDAGSAPNTADTKAPTSTKPTPKPTAKASNTTTMANSTVKPTPTVKAGPTLIPGQVTLVPGYNDCGGFGFNYTVYMPEDPASAYTMLTCDKGYRCQEARDSDLYRCNEWPSREPVAFYGQCGGGNYDGQKFCAPGAVCKYISASFSQCLPTY